MQKYVNKLIDHKVRKVDRYVNNGSTWLIFTQEKKWVIELTKEGTLWYNYNFFKNVFSFLGLDVVENQHYITKWVEDNVIRDGVKVANKSLRVDDSCLIQDTIEDGVKQTRLFRKMNSSVVEDTIQNGVKDTRVGGAFEDVLVENTIENGVKQLRHRKGADDTRAENIIQNGVKDTRKQTVTSQIVVENTIRNGVKETELHEGVRPLAVNNTIENGVKQTYSGGDVCRNDSIEDTIDKGVKETICLTMDYEEFVEDTIQNGVKETHRDAERHPKTVEDTIQNGVKHTNNKTNILQFLVEDTIQNGVKQTCAQIPSIDAVVERVVEERIKETRRFGLGNEAEIEDAIQNGVIETTPGGYLGSVEMKGKAVHQFEHAKQNDDVNDVIKNGVKDTRPEVNMTEGEVEEIIENGVKHILFDNDYSTNFIEKTIADSERKGWPIIDDMVENKVKHTMSNPTKRTYYVDDTIQNGVVDTRPMEEWVNSENIVNKTIQNGIKETKTPGDDGDLLSTMEWMEEYETNSVPKLIDYVVKHGVKETKSVSNDINEILRSDKITPHTYADESTQDSWVENVIEKGVKEINAWDDDILGEPDNLKMVIKETNPTNFANFGDAIENGIKNTYSDKIPNDYDWSDEFESDVEAAIQNGINMTMGAYSSRLPNPVENVIKNGIKETHDDVYPHTARIEGVIKNGVKECVPVHHKLYNPMDFSVTYRENHRLDDVTSVLENGIKEVQPLPAQDGNMDWGNYYHRQEDRTKPHTQYVNDVIEGGTKLN